MSSVQELIKIFNPIMAEVSARIEAKQATELDRRIVTLIERFDGSLKISSSFCTIESRPRNVNLSTSLSLADLKTCQLCGEKVFKPIVKYLNLEDRLREIMKTFPFVERLKEASDRVLDHISLFSLQLTRLDISLERSAVWLALIPDEQFLNIQVDDLDKLCRITTLALERLRDIEEQKPALLNALREVPFTGPWFYQKLDLTVGKLHVLSGEQLNGIAGRLQMGTCELISDDQLKTVDFNSFTGEKLDKMIAGKGEEEDIRRRLAILNPEQIRIYIQKSSGSYFGHFPDAFYESLQLSTFNKKQLGVIFKDHYGQPNGTAKRHLQLVSPQEISNGLDLLPTNLLSMTSELQVSLLDYSKITSEEQVKELFIFYKFAGEETEQRVQLIPEPSVNHVVDICYAILPYLSKSQCGVLDTALLGPKEVECLFPGFSLETLYPDYQRTEKNILGQVRHIFTKDEGSGSKSHSHTQSELEAIIKNRMVRSVFTANKFSVPQVQAMMPMMYPEVRELLEKFCQRVEQTS